MNNEACKECRAHGRLDQRVSHVERDACNLWRQVDGMKKFIMGTLLSSVLSLIGIIAMLGIRLFIVVK